MEVPAQQENRVQRASEEQLKGLREEMQRAGTRHLLASEITGIVALLAAGTAYAITIWSSPQSVPWAWFFSACLLFLVGTVGFVLTFLVSLGTRGARRRKIRAALRGLTREDQLRVVDPLLREPLGDTAALLRPVLRDLGLPTELTPAATPEGSGAEVSGVAQPVGESLERLSSG